MRGKKKLYYWEGIDDRGFKESGEEEALSDINLRVELKKRGIKANKIRRRYSLFKKKIKTSEVSIFTRQFATMVSSGVPIQIAFEIGANSQKNNSFKSIVYDVRSRVEAGASLKEAFSAHPKQFNDLYVNMISVGETGGFLPESLTRLADYLEKTESIKKKIKKATIYPIIILLVALISVLIILIKVIPSLKEIFDSSGASMPAFTLFVLGISDFMVKYWYVIFGSLFSFFLMLFYFYKKSYSFRRKIHYFLLKLPVMGKMLSLSIIAKWSRTLSAMYSAGVSIDEILLMSSKIPGNIVYEEKINTIRKDVLVGIPVDVSVQRSEVFSDLVVQMLRVGTHSGEIDSVMSKVADITEEELNNMIDNSFTLIEPFILIFLGVVIGAVVIAMYLPLFNMASAF